MLFKVSFYTVKLYGEETIQDSSMLYTVKRHLKEQNL